jgi:hypothetical protein
MPDDEIDDRLSRRFGADEETDDQSQQSKSDMHSQNDSASQTSQKDNASQTSQNVQTVKNIKEEWNVRSFYLDNELEDELTTAFKRLDFQLSEAGADVDLQKTRHFYPLIVELGLERLDEMEVTEVTERLERTD